MPIRRVGGSELAASVACTGTLGAVAFGGLTGIRPQDDGPTVCLFRLVTGLPCPFCGLTRSMFALGQGDLGDSVRYSPIGPLVAAVAVAVAVAVMVSVTRGQPLGWPRPLLALGTMILALSWAFQISQGAQ